MAEHEFELYLKLLASLLDLDPAQREEIRDELRDHLEERLTELAELGIDRETAIERALEEFGDAAGLAGSFTKLARQRKRRVLVQRTLGSAVVLTLLILVSVSFWPAEQQNPVVPARAGAQEGDVDGLPGATDDPGLGRRGADLVDLGDATSLRRRVEASLEKPVDVRFEAVPFREAVNAIGEQIGVDILIDEIALANAGVDKPHLVALSLRHAQPPARIALDLLVETSVGDADLSLVGDTDLSFVVREGFVQLTELDHDTLQVEVYNVRDLVGHGPKPATGLVPRQGNDFGPGPPRPGPADGGLDVPPTGSSDVASSSDGSPAVRLVQFDGGGFGGVPPYEPPVDGIKGLVHVIETTIDPDSWEPLGGPGSAAAFEGLLIVSTTPEIHRRIRALLEELRSAVGPPMAIDG